MSSKAVVVRARGVRLIDGVVIAAVALLALKVLGIMSWLTSPAPPPAPNELPAFARVLAHARTNYEPPDVTTTGTVGPKAEHGAPAAAAAEPAPAAPPAAASASIVSPSERLILERLSERRDQLDQREADLAMRTSLLEAAEKRLDERTKELAALEARVASLVDEKQAAEEAYAEAGVAPGEVRRCGAKPLSLRCCCDPHRPRQSLSSSNLGHGE